MLLVRDFDIAADASEAPSIVSDVPLGTLGNALQARAVIDRWRSEEKNSVADKKLCTCDFASWVGVGKARDFIDKVFQIAKPSGARDLYVLDVILPTVVFTACMETADTLVGEDKPAKNLHHQKAQRKLRRILNDKVDQPTYNYLETITNLTIMALLLDIWDSGKDHCNILAYSGEQAMFKDFFADKHLEEAMEEVDEAKKEAGHPVTGIVYSVPAPEMKGSLREKIVMYETAAFGEYELKEKAPVVGAVQVGVDLMGKPSPNNHKDPLNFICAVYRHLGDSDTIVAEGTPYE